MLDLGCERHEQSSCSNSRLNMPNPSILLTGLILTFGTFAAKSTEIHFSRTPNGGIQPQTLVDAAGVVHLIYFKGEARAGDVFYSNLKPGSSEFSAPIQVNSHPGSAIAVGTIRGAQMAIGKNGRVHVVWNGNSSASDAHEGVPLWFARLNDARDGFEPQRDLMTFTASLDGGGSVAADSDGNVYAVWHAHPPGAEKNETARAVFVARSTDDGKSFSAERRATLEPTGACGCCGLKAFADRGGAVYVLYRAAFETVKRDEVMMVSRDRGETFQIAYKHPWQISTCPMSSASFADGPEDGTLAAWETAGQVYFALVRPGNLAVSKPSAPPGKGKRKHPALAMNQKGETLMVWAGGTGWNKGGSLAWQLFDREGNQTSEHGERDGIPVWSFASAYARPDGTFVILY